VVAAERILPLRLLLLRAQVDRVGHCLVLHLKRIDGGDAARRVGQIIRARATGQEGSILQCRLHALGLPQVWWASVRKSRYFLANASARSSASELECNVGCLVGPLHLGRRARVSVLMTQIGESQSF
jgi:hypothetical protein